VVGTAAGIIAQLVAGGSFGSAALVIRTFRIGRILRLVRRVESMSELFSTLLLTLPSLGNVGALLFLLFFIYSGKPTLCCVMTYNVLLKVLHELQVHGTAVHCVTCLECEVLHANT
jgi:Ion transport protein